MSTIAEIEVVFLSEPVIGRRAEFLRDGQRASSSPVRNVWPDHGTQGRYHIETSSGSRYAGSIYRENQTRYLPSQTMYGSPPPPQIPSVANIIPDIQGLNWGAFLLAPFWSVAHNVWIGLLCLIPGLGWIVSIILLIKGNDLAWQNRRFRDANHFYDVQRAWMIWGIVLAILNVLVAIAVWVFFLPFLFLTSL